MSSPRRVQRALLSVSNKTGILELARVLDQLGIEILSTGGTANLLRKHHLPVIEVADHTGFPEIMAGRVKTLHPKIHGGLLGRRGLDDNIMADNDILAIDLLVVNLYPFIQAVSHSDCSLETAIENIDIGGPAMLRSAAKNFQDVVTLIDTEDYEKIIAELLTNDGFTSLETRFKLARKVFAHIAAYDAAIANYLGKKQLDDSEDLFPETYTLQVKKQFNLRYGENPQQKAAFYVDNTTLEPGIATAIQQQGKALSYNNIADADAAIECVKQFTNEHACVIVKHANPCGVALAEDQILAYQHAFATDPSSAFGGIIAFNHELTAATAEAIVKNQFVEVIIAPAISANAQIILAAKPNIRALSTGQWNEPIENFDYKRVTGGLLIQERDLAEVDFLHAKIVTQRQPSTQEMQDLAFAWRVVKFVKSNAIVYAKDNRTIGIGAGQMSRVFSAIVANLKAEAANLSVPGSVMASDAFFPFRDGVDAAAKVGITAIIQPGGSVRDEEVIKAADEANIAMIFTGIRHFRH